MLFIYKMNARKVSHDIENPIDNLLLKFNEKMNPIYKKLNFTPNILTTISFVVTLIGIYVYYNNYKKINLKIIALILIFVGYYFDCADGNFARTYKMTSEFGDFYDHICDNLKFVIMFYAVFKIKSIPMKRKLIASIIIIVFTFLNFVNLGCQEKIYEKKKKTLKSKTLEPLKMLCFNENLINYVKYFGGGTLFIVIFITLLLI